MPRNYKMIMVFVLLAIVMFLTGSIVINLYNRSTDDVKTDVGFHWWIGLLSILGGLIAIGASVLIAVYPTQVTVVKQVVGSRAVAVGRAIRGKDTAAVQKEGTTVGS